LINETARKSFQGLGKPEPLRHQLKGWWRPSISDEYRLVYGVIDDALVIAACRLHYE
jgi:toxin YoeB